MISGVIFVDCRGNEYPVSIAHAVSREIFCQAINLLFSGKAYEAVLHRSNINWGDYELVMCQNTSSRQMVELDDEGWGTIVEAGSKILMVPLYNDYEWYLCPHCDGCITVDPNLEFVECRWCQNIFRTGDDESRWRWICNKTETELKQIEEQKPTRRKGDRLCYLGSQQDYLKSIQRPAQ
ncbi:hypothetical protein CPB83DRAFT_664346 [Crepidotus variabilis]|uniref:Ubiquitin-like domain-containing protein n=1 Tax=Crepidotus variabilis TaxID=179855 RepID=A0A9P6JSQ1_9AGAR|nr:hypothetical protein CPB83DRAFT_664346 [Crepidotus variabilis]